MKRNLLEQSIKNAITKSVVAFVNKMSEEEVNELSQEILGATVQTLQAHSQGVEYVYDLSLIHI